MKNTIKGGCLCGIVKYEIIAKPVGAGNCHCRTCQKAAGSPYMPALFVPFDALKITGKYKEYASISDSGNTIYRGFCPECGTTLFGRNSGNDKTRPVNASTLDNPDIYKPQMDFWVTDAQSWDYLNPELPKFDKNPSHS